ncbi:hypothetical protein QBC44DRAFT_375214 [Cladorrhinum sp. PSN332]|nr:hypothetical protein QBC44DRAFT_375214 [Cladorrhinum sp. PSN332]
MASFALLPPELKLQIGTHLDIHSLSRIVKTSRENNTIFTELLYQQDAQRKTSSPTGPQAMAWGALTGNLRVLDLAFNAGGGQEAVSSLSHTTPRVLSKLNTAKLALFPQRFGTPLHYAVIANQYGAAKWLLDHGAIQSLKIGSQGLCRCRHLESGVADPWWLPAHHATLNCYNRPSIWALITARCGAKFAQVPASEVEGWAGECQGILGFLLLRHGAVDADYLAASDYDEAIKELFAASTDESGIRKGVAVLARERVLRKGKTDRVELLAGAD